MNENFVSKNRMKSKKTKKNLLYYFDDDKVENAQTQRKIVIFHPIYV